MKKNNTQEEITIKLRRFKMEWIEPNKTIIFIGKRKTGKSVLALDYLYHNQDIPFCTCISPTDDLNLTFRPHIPSRFIFDAYSPKLIENFVKRQRTISRKKKSAEKGFGDPKYTGSSVIYIVVISLFLLFLLILSIVCSRIDISNKWIGNITKQEFDFDDIFIL